MTNTEKACLKFHISLNVSNLDRALDFYRVLFGMEPSKCHDDYAKFELADPPVVFSLVPLPSLAGGSIAKIGLRLSDEDAVAVVRSRVTDAGIATQCPCGGGQSKFYVADPDLNIWQIYCGDDTGLPPITATVNAQAAPAPATGPVVWEHYVTQPMPERIPHDDASVDEARLTGTFNASLDDGQRAGLLREVSRVLRRPGGRVVVHGLAGDRAFRGEQPKLPGLAAMVSRVPVQTEPIDALRAAGFVGIQFVKLTEQPWFEIDGVEMREFKLTACQPAKSNGVMRPVIYRGPFRQAVDEAGNVFPRGERVMVSEAACAVLRDGAAVDQFHFPQLDAGSGACALPK